MLPDVYLLAGPPCNDAACSTSHEVSALLRSLLVLCGNHDLYLIINASQKFDMPSGKYRQGLCPV